MLALICGTGDLPARIAQAQSNPPLVCMLDGFAPSDLTTDLMFRLENLGTLLQTLTQRGITEICLCGAISRPAVDPAKIDAATLPLVPILQRALGQGDDGALRAVVQIFEDAGFVVRGAADLAPDLLSPPGVPTRAQPNMADRAAVQEALMALAEMGARDLGQACVVQDGIVTAREDIRGTDAMLSDLARTGPQPQATGVLDWGLDQIGAVLDDTADWLSNRAPGAPRGILYKAPKPGQELRADMPTIGPATALGAARAGLDGIVIQADGVMVIDRAVVLDHLDRAGLFLWVR